MEEQIVRKPNPGAKKWIILGAVLGLLAAGAVFLFGVNRFYLSIQLLGEEHMTLEYGESFVEPGAQVRLHGTLMLQNGITSEDMTVTISGTVGEELGDYTVTYASEYGWLSASESRSVSVVDSVAPEITLVSSGEPLIAGTPYSEEGFTAQDNYDGDITHRVERQELYGKVLYQVEDSSGNVTTVEREIPYFDPIPPTILLEGGENMTLSIGQSYAEPGFLAVDNVDGELTEQVLVEGEVDCFVPGTYTVSYSVSDGFENFTLVQRTVEVVKQPRVEVEYPQGKVIYLTFDDGPGPFTDELLYLLDYYDVKATFFVTDSGYDHLLKQIVEEGHSIGIHTMTHDYAEIYASPEAFFADLYGMQAVIQEATGVKTTLMRFPGGGSNLVSRRFYPGLMTLLTEAVQDAGFQYFDWNVDSKDAGGASEDYEVSENVIEGIQRERISVVLQHDIHPFSVNAVEAIILWGLDNGYTFLPMEPSSPGCHHPVYN